MRSLAWVGVFLALLTVADNQFLLRIEGSAEPSLLAQGPWSNAALAGLGPGNVSPAAPVFLGLVLLAILCGLYATGLWIAGFLPPFMGKAQAGFRVVLLVSAFLVGTAVIAPPIRDADIAFYAFQGRMIARDRLNPYLVLPHDLASDPWYPLLSPSWRDRSTAYGPVSLLVATAVDAAVDRGGAGPDFVRMLLSLRALFAGLTLANTVLIWLILADLAPGRRLAGALAYAWNPAVILVGVEHNDTLMLFLALLGIFLHLRGRTGGATIAFTLSALVKYVTVPLLIGYLVWRWHQDEPRGAWRFGLPCLSAAVGLLTLALFDPVAVAGQMPIYLEQSGRLAHLAQLPFEVFLVLAAGVIVFLARTRSWEEVLQHGMVALVVYLGFFSRDWFPWYLVSAVGLGAVLGGWWLDLAAVASGAWLLQLHEGLAYLGGIGRLALGWSPDRTAEVVALGPAVVAVGLSLLWLRRGWDRRVFYQAGLLTLAVGTTIVATPLQLHWNDVPPGVGSGVMPVGGPVVFGDTLNWEDWSWGTTVSQVGTPAGPAGPRSLCLTFTSADSGFYAHDPGFATRGYATFDFDLGPPGRSLPALSLGLRGPTGQTLTTVPLAPYVQSAATDAGWRTVAVPLTTLDGTDSEVTGVVIQSQTTGSSSLVCLQDVRFR